MQLTAINSPNCPYKVLMVCYVAILAFGWCAHLLAPVFAVLFQFFCVVLLCERKE